MNEELAKRAVACKHWAWMQGMLTTSEMRVVSVGHASLIVLDDEFDLVEITDGKAIPNLDDPATLGCLLALVREAWGDTLAVCIPRSHTNWEVRLVPLHGWTHCAWGNSEIEALVAALEAAP
jgi:hypothetical protein